MNISRLSFDTRAVKAGREDLESIGAHVPPIDLSTTYPLNNLEGSIQDFADLASGENANGRNSIYARLHNPTVDRFEKALANLESAESALAFSSGMAALTAVIHRRNNVVAMWLL